MVKMASVGAKKVPFPFFKGRHTSSEAPNSKFKVNSRVSLAIFIPSLQFD
jgi:hypothetical protein